MPSMESSTPLANAEKVCQESGGSDNVSTRATKESWLTRLSMENELLIVMCIG